MISELDQSLENLLKGEAPAGTELAGATVSFGAPDQTWRGSGSSLELDVYLYQLLENRELRSNARSLRQAPGGGVTVEPFPARVECSYLLTAWNKSSGPTTEEKERAEHRLLAQVLYVLLRNPTLPAAYLTPSLAPAQELGLPVIAAQPDGPATGVDFWTGLGTYLRPSVSCKVTLTIDLDRSVTGPEATFVSLHVGGDERTLLGGVVRDASTPTETVAEAWIRVTETGETAVTDGAGRFVLERVTPGACTLTVRASGFRETVATVGVPAPSGVYEVTLRPL